MKRVFLVGVIALVLVPSAAASDALLAPGEVVRHRCAGGSAPTHDAMNVNIRALGERLRVVYRHSTATRAEYRLGSAFAVVRRPEPRRTTVKNLGGIALRAELRC